jgi:hypothetical protein
VRGQGRRGQPRVRRGARIQVKGAAPFPRKLRRPHGSSTTRDVGVQEYTSTPTAFNSRRYERLRRGCTGHYA